MLQRSVNIVSRRVVTKVTSQLSVRFASSVTEQPVSIRKTALFDFHAEHKAKFVPFAGWKMPVMYPEGMKQEHLHCRNHASIFDVSHMGQIKLHGKDAMDFIETLVPGNIKDLKDNAARLTQFTNLHGGIMDDTVVTRKNDKLLYIVVNAGCCDQDVQHIKENLNRYKLQNPQADVAFEFMEGQSLVALQGPEAPDVLQPLLTSDINLANLPFMSCVDVNLPALSNTPVQISRCGYTGEDGFEISVPDIYVTQFTELLLKDQRVKLAGLGARDTLRLEAGLCLMGHDMNDQITPIEAGLSFTIGKRRQEEANFPGATVINNQIKNGTNIKRIGLLLDTNKMVAREGYVIRDEKFTTDVGHVTSGTISPILDKSIAMGYVNSAVSTEGTKLVVSIRGQPFQATVVKMPFVPHRYYRKPVTKK